MSGPEGRGPEGRVPVDGGAGDHDRDRDAWLTEALRHAPDAAAAPPLAVREAILAEARQAASHGTGQAVSHGAPPAAPAGRRPAVHSTGRGRRSIADRLLDAWRALAAPPVAAGFATVMLAVLVGVMWHDRPMDEAMPAPPPPRDAAPPAAPRQEAAGPPAESATTGARARAPLAEPAAAVPLPPVAGARESATGNVAEASAPRPPSPSPSPSRTDATPSSAKRVEAKREEAERAAPAADTAAPATSRQAQSAPSALARARDDAAAGPLRDAPLATSPKPAPMAVAPPPVVAPAARPAPAPAPAAAAQAQPFPASPPALATPGFAPRDDVAPRRLGAAAPTAAEPSPRPRESARADAPRADAGRAEASAADAGPAESRLAADRDRERSATLRPLAALLRSLDAGDARWTRVGDSDSDVDAALRDWLIGVDAAAAGRWRAGRAPMGETGGSGGGGTVVELRRNGRPAATLRIDATGLAFRAADGSESHAPLAAPTSAQLRRALPAQR